MTLSNLIHFGRPSSLTEKRRSDPFFSLQSEVNRLFQDFGGLSSTSSFSKGDDKLMMPAMDVIEKDKSYVTQIELAGMDKKDVTIDIHHNHLIIAGEKKEEKTSESDLLLCKECAYGAFRRVIQLPDEADMDKAKAVFNHGRLVITIPKRTGAKPGKRSLQIED